MRVRIAALLLVLLGVAQMFADLSGWTQLQGLAAATTASPAPRVFSAVDGFETFSTEFFLVWRDADGNSREQKLESDRYARLRGPYNRRNAYGAVVAFAPVLVARPATRELFDHVARYALCGEAPLLAELGLDPAPGSIQLRLEPRQGTSSTLPMQFELDCQP